MKKWYLLNYIYLCYTEAKRLLSRWPAIFERAGGIAFKQRCYLIYSSKLTKHWLYIPILGQAEIAASRYSRICNRFPLLLRVWSYDLQLISAGGAIIWGCRPDIRLRLIKPFSISPCISLDINILGNILVMTVMTVLNYVCFRLAFSCCSKFIFGCVFYC